MSVPPAMFYIVMSIDLTNKIVAFHCLTDSDIIAKATYIKVSAKYKYRKVNMICSGTNYKDVDGLNLLYDTMRIYEEENSNHIVYKIFSKL